MGEGGGAGANLGVEGEEEELPPQAGVAGHAGRPVSLNQQQLDQRATSERHTRALGHTRAHTGRRAH